MLGHASRMLLGAGPPPDGAPPGTHGDGAAHKARRRVAGLAPAVGALAACTVLGVYAGPLGILLQSAARTLTGAS